MQKPAFSLANILPPASTNTQHSLSLSPSAPITTTHRFTCQQHLPFFIAAVFLLSTLLWPLLSSPPFLPLVIDTLIPKRPNPSSCIPITGHSRLLALSSYSTFSQTSLLSLTLGSPCKTFLSTYCIANLSNLIFPFSLDHIHTNPTTPLDYLFP